MIRSLFIFLCLGLTGIVSADEAVAKLQSTITISPTRGPKINPSTHVILSANVKNVGNGKSLPGEIFIRFSFRPPHESEPNSVLFQTEKVELPSLDAGEERMITFKTNHLLPTVYDYVRHDWAMREYEAIVEIKGKSQITGTRALSFTAHYYEGCSTPRPCDFEQQR